MAARENTPQLRLLPLRRIHFYHRATLLCALAAYLSTLTTMIHTMCRVFFTFLSTRIADVCTWRTESCCMITANAHEPCRSVTHLGAFSVQFNTTQEHLYIVFAKAFHRAKVACSGAIETGVYTRLYSFVIHSHVVLVEQSDFAPTGSICVPMRLSDPQRELCAFTRYPDHHIRVESVTTCSKSSTQD